MSKHSSWCEVIRPSLLHLQPESLSMTKRPTDHLEPAPKKRAGDRQISREEPPSDSDGEQVSRELFLEHC